MADMRMLVLGLAERQSPFFELVDVGEGLVPALPFGDDGAGVTLAEGGADDTARTMLLIASVSVLVMVSASVDFGSPRI
jgi:hypothetical protein